MGQGRNYKIGIDLEADDNASGAVEKLSGAAGSLDGAFKTASGGAGGLGASLTSMLNPAGLALGAVTAIGGAAVAVAGQAMALSDQVRDSTNSMTSQLGLTSESAQVFEDTMRDIYAANYGEGFEDIGASMVAVEQNLNRLGISGAEYQEDLEQMTIQAISFADAFDGEVGETVSAQVTLMESFGLTATQAMDFLVAGQQRGLDASGDFLDSIGEYSVQFSAGGATAAEFFSVLETGLQGGALGTDKAADAFKEFSIRIVDNSDNTRWALEEMGIDYAQLTQGFQDGSITTMDAMTMVIAKINEIEDPIERNKQGVRLFGTQWEDITEDVLLNIDSQRRSMEDLEGSAESLEAQYQGSGAAGATAMRQWENALVDLGDEFNILKEAVLPALAGAVNDYIIPAIGYLTDFVGWLREAERSDFWTRVDEGFNDLVGLPNTGDEPAAEGSGLGVVNPQNIPIVAPGATASSSMSNSNNETTVIVNVERGDPALVAEGTEIGIKRAQQIRGE